MNKLKILILDDNEIFRKGIAKLLTDIPLIKVVRECESIMMAIDLIENQNVNILIMDTNVKGMESTSFVKKIQSIQPNLKIIVLTRELNVSKVLEIVKAGVSSYLLKDTTLKELVHAIELANTGESYFPKKISSIIFQQLANPVSQSSILNNGNVSLTSREKEILEYISQEFTNKEIASKLFISHRTVDTHRRNLLLKLDVKNTAGLVRYFYSNLNKDQRRNQY
ncbi:MAG: LuxR C-terminal-related transcriptional regulator [Saprospiraceae bacterium]